jgi:hypothetical protein
MIDRVFRRQEPSRPRGEILRVAIRLDKDNVQDVIRADA